MMGYRITNISPITFKYLLEIISYYQPPKGEEGREPTDAREHGQRASRSREGVGTGGLPQTKPRAGSRSMA